MAFITGGCLCGRVRYRAVGDPAFSGVCHCRNCQRFTGSAFEPIIAFPASSVTIKGELKTYQDTADSGKAAYRQFCPNCGSGMTMEVAIRPGIVLILAGSLDDPSGFNPPVELFCASAQPWVHAGGERKQFAGMPG